MRQIYNLAALLLLAGGLCGQDFTNVAPSMNISPGFGSGELGGGVSFHDFNGDGWDDLTFCSEAGAPMQFYVNNNGVMQAISPLVNVMAESKEAIWVDYDNDGDKDLFVAIRLGPNRLYENTGGLNMVNVSSTAFGSQGNRPSQGAVWGDLNKDGWLDCYVANFDYEGSGLNGVWMNNGDGTFSDISASSGAGEGVNPTFDAVILDYNMDGWPDIYTSNDKYEFPNSLLRNDNGTGFTDVSAASGTNIGINSMNAGGADYDNDGDLDIYCSNTEEGNVLLQNQGDGTFTDATLASGTGFYRVGWAATFFDYNNDGWKDLYVSAMSFHIPSEHNALYVNQGDGTFTEPLFGTGGLGGIDYGLSLSHAIGDLNNDGRLDIAISQMDGDDPLLWRNDETDVNNWIKVNLFGTTSNTGGIGSVIEIWADGAYQMQYTHCTMGYQGQSSGNYHFGLGTATGIDSMKITWPSGIVDKLINITNLNTVEFVTEGSFALPVRLVDFEVEALGEKAMLQWTTAEEQNTERFNVERSLDGRSFQTMGWVRAAGNSQELQQYSFEDNLPLDRTVYYRLKIIDADASFEYSPLRAIRPSTGNDHVNNAFTVVELPQNPTLSGEDMKFALESRVDASLTATLVSRAGRLIRSQQFNTTNGLNRFTFDGEQLPAGSYFLRLELDGLMKSYQIVIAR